MITGFAFFISVFFAPIFASIPPWATGGALVIVGSLMIRKYVPHLQYYFERLIRNFLVSERSIGIMSVTPFPHF